MCDASRKEMTEPEISMSLVRMHKMDEKFGFHEYQKIVTTKFNLTPVLKVVEGSPVI